MMRYPLSILLLAVAAPAMASPGPAPQPDGLTIEPSVTCRAGEQAEFIRLSRARGDAIDGVFALCRDPALSQKAWIRRLKTTRDMLAMATGDRAARAAIRKAFADHIARERATKAPGR
jgi:hypothetical protein